MNAERGHANIQGNTDNAISWEILARLPQGSAPRSEDDRRLRQGERFEAKKLGPILELLRHQLQEVHGQLAQDVVWRQRDRAATILPSATSPSRRGNASWMSIYDQALHGKMEGRDALGDDRDQYRPGHRPGADGAVQPQMAGRDGPVPDDQL